MKAFVITLNNIPESVKVAKRCIDSGKTHGIDIKMFEAITPDIGIGLAEIENVNTAGFDEKYSRRDNAIATFMSHYSLWQNAIKTNEDHLIFEHDVVITAPLPYIPVYNGVVNLGQPSYGGYNTPQTLGLGPLFSKPYFPGAHAYMVSPQGAKALIAQASVYAGPTDVYLNIDTFPFLQEYYPWIADVRDTFSTIQKMEGVYAKHGYQKLDDKNKYRLI